MKGKIRALTVVSSVAVKKLEARHRLAKESVKQAPVLGLFVTRDKAGTGARRTLYSVFCAVRSAVKSGKNIITALRKRRVRQERR